MRRLGALLFPLGFTLSPTAVLAEARPTAVLLTVPTSVAVGERFTITARLTVPNGEVYGAVENEVLQLLLDGVHYRRERTNFAGAAQFVITQPITVGQHTVTVLYEGSKSLQPAAATAVLTIAPAVLEVETVPALPGVIVRAQGMGYRTGSDGIARIPFDAPGSYEIEIEREVLAPEFRAHFARWNDDWFSPHRSVVVPKQKRLQVGFEIETTISYHFVDLEKRPVDPKLIDLLVIKSSIGEVRDLLPSADETSRTVKSSRTVLTHSGLVSMPTQWSVDTIIVRGTNVVNRNQQRFYPSEDREWELKLLLYDLTVSVRDTLFDLPTGRSIQLIYPDGSSEVFPLAEGKGIIRSLPRGEYRIRAVGLFGWSPTAPLALSRNQDVTLTVVSGWDMLAVSSLVASFVAAALLVGRPHLTRLYRKQRNQGRVVSVAVPESGTRQFALVALLLSALIGTFILTSGLARPDHQQPSKTGNKDLSRPQPTQLPTPLRVHASGTSTPEPAEIAVAPEFRDFWVANWGL